MQGDLLGGDNIMTMVEGYRGLDHPALHPHGRKARIEKGAIVAQGRRASAAKLFDLFLGGESMMMSLYRPSL